jgi:hypothetical protein
MATNDSPSVPRPAITPEQINAAISAGFTRPSRKIPMPTTISRAAQAWLAIYHGKSWGEIGQKLVTKQEPVDGERDTSASGLGAAGAASKLVGRARCAWQRHRSTTTTRLVG